MKYVIPTSSARHIAKGLERYEGLEVIFPGKNKEDNISFPDGERYTTIPEMEELTGEEIYLLHSGQPYPNAGLVELWMNYKIAITNNCIPNLFFLYFPYGMQDNTWEKGELNVAKEIISNLFANNKGISIIDAHFQGNSLFDKYLINYLSAVPLIKEVIERDYGEDILYLAPDAGSQKRTGLEGTEKKRENSYTVQIKTNKKLQEKVKGKKVVCIDDILETGGTILKFAEKCKEIGAEEIIVGVTHGVLQKGYNRLVDSGIISKIYMTNTIDRNKTNVDITDYVAKSILSK